jgi:ferrous iron transport protein A
MRLTEMKTGSRGIVRDIRGGYGMRRRLAGMGVHPGDKIDVSRASALRGPMLIIVHDAQIALGWGMAMCIEVEEAGTA